MEAERRQRAVDTASIWRSDADVPDAIETLMRTITRRWR